MAFFTPAITSALISGGLAAAGTAGGGLLSMFSNNAQAQRQAQLTQEQLDLDRQNQVQQQMVQALVNQRAVAGSADSMGTTQVYDPQTNTWKTTLGPLPQAATEAATRAGIQQNTVDRARQELINQVAARRAADAAPAADAAARDVASFRPMQGSELTGLLTDQGITAARQAYDPLRADVLRSTARTGTAAGPVLAELGRSEAQNLRNTLTDAQIQGLTGVENINQQRLGNLTSRAGTTAALATPSISPPPIAGDQTSNLLSQLTSQRAGSAGGTTAQGAFGANQAEFGANQAAAGVKTASTDFGLQQAGAGLKDLGGLFAPKGAGSDLVSLLMQKYGGGLGTSTATTNPSPFTQDDQGNIQFG